MAAPGTGNELRDTPGRLLLGWAVLMVSLVILAWRIHLNSADYEWTEYPTALGDTRYYTPLGEDDRYAPNLRFPGHESGLYRRSAEPVTLDDATMLKLTLESTGKHLVYQRAEDFGSSSSTSTASAVYLKSGENRYVEFGARKFYPPYVPKVGP
ncbi:MAG: hypothetical protein ACO1TE_19620 [Prosthecobacter sp.]